MPAYDAGGAAGCAEAFSSAFNGGWDANGAHARALLLFCFGANEYNTGIGYGWDGADYTEAEYLVENKDIEAELQGEIFDLYDQP